MQIDYLSEIGCRVYGTGTKATPSSGRIRRMLRRRATTELHRSAIRLSLLDAIVLAPVIALPLIFVASLALFSMVMLLAVTACAVAATIVADVVRRHWRAARQPVVMPRRAIG